MRIASSIVLSLLLSTSLCFCQQGISLNTDAALKGYILYETDDIGQVLIDNCGEIVHKWENISNVHLHAKLQKDGTLTYIRSGELRVADWEGNIIYSFRPEDPDLRLVYEAILMDNGNYLCITRKNLTDFEFEEIGYDVSRIEDGSHFPEKTDGIIEIDPIQNKIVWEWNIKDHVIQQRDASKNNYGSLYDNPQLLNIDAILDTWDWQYDESFMINGFDYNEELDQLALSVRKMNEVVIIDHSTTTIEAAGSSGGNSGMGGDIIYRFGNPQNYNRGTAEDRVLFYQHNPNWIKYGEHAGKIICYNNGLGRPDVFDPNDRYSSIPIFDPIENGSNYVLETGEPYAPIQPEVQFNKLTTGTHFYSGYTSAAQVLTNGNILITEGVNGKIMEIDLTGQIVWAYDGDEGNGSYLFRAEKYPLDYPAFENKDLSSTGEVVEFPPSQYNCNIFTTSNEETLEASKFSIVNNQNRLSIISHADFQYSIFDISGKKIITGERESESHEIDISFLHSGLYFIQLNTINQNTIENIKFFKY